MTGRFAISGFKGFDFDAQEQPSFWLEWAPAGTGTAYSLYRRGVIGPVYRFTVSRSGQRFDQDVQPRTWIGHLFPRYPKLAN